MALVMANPTWAGGKMKILFQEEDCTRHNNNVVGQEKSSDRCDHGNKVDIMITSNRIRALKSQGVPSGWKFSHRQS